MTITEINEQIKQACLRKESELVINGAISESDTKTLKNNGFNVLKRRLIKADRTEVTTYRIMW